MKLKIYTIYDKVAVESGPVWVAKNDGIAYRQFQQLIIENKAKGEDFTLHCIGEYDPEKMNIIPMEWEVKPTLEMET